MAKLKGNRKLAALFIVLSIAWIAMLFAESSQPPAKIMGEISGLDKLAHFVAFGILALLFFGVSLCQSAKSNCPLLSTPLVLTILVGVLDEGYQMMIPDRAASFFDLAADVFGAIMAIYLARRLLAKIGFRSLAP